MRKRRFVPAALIAAVSAGALFVGPSAAADAADMLWGDRLRATDDVEASIPSLGEIIVEDFEDQAAAPWLVSMPYSDGVAETKIAQSAGGAGKALGFRVLFMRRAQSKLDLRPSRPIRIEDDCRSFSVRAYGNGIPHELRLLVLDYYGKESELSFGSLGFIGWRKLELALPRKDGGTAYVQDDRHYRDPAGLRISGLRVAFAMEESYGEYIAYFDDLGAIVDRSGADVSSTDVAISPAGADTGALGDAVLPDQPGAGAEPAEKAAKAKAIALDEITKRIAASMVYPEAARLRGIEGSMILAFRIGIDGSLIAPRVEKGSGSEILDRSGLELLSGAFPAPNDSGLELEMSVPVTFRLED